MKSRATNSIKPTIVSFILDESGSMSSVQDSVISGFNEYVGALKSKKGEFLLTLTKFDSNGLRTPYKAEKIDKVPNLDRESYQPGALTPLYDAVCLTVKGVERRAAKDQSVIVAIMTDGQENASKEFTEANLRELVTRLEGEGNWTFVFMGANQDSWAVAQKFGIQTGNIANWQATEEGTRVVLKQMAAASMDFRESMTNDGPRRSSRFFNQDDEQ